MENLILALASIALLAYLAAAILFPEKF